MLNPIILQNDGVIAVTNSATSYWFY